MIKRNRSNGVSRREFLFAGGSLLILPLAAGAQTKKADSAESGLSDEEKKQVAAVRDQARKASLGPLSLTPGDHYLVVGNASDDFQSEVLGFCEKLGKAFLAYYNSKGFQLDYPENRMTVVILKDRKSYGAWIGGPAEDAIGGHYDRDSNQLVVFDFRNDPKGLGDQARVVNSFTLSHEANHLLGFNTGLLSRAADTPTFIIEGLATIGELVQKNRTSAFGDTNSPRIGAMVQAIRGGSSWLELKDLIAKDELCEEPETFQLAYAEGNLFVSMMIKNPEKLARFRAYLESLKKPGKTRDRLQAAEAALGSLDSLNRELKIKAKPYLKR